MPYALTPGDPMETGPLLAGVALLTVAAPFELTEPLVRLPRQSISSLEAAVLVAFAAWAVAIVASRRLPEWRTPLTLPWVALLAAMTAASLWSPISRLNALHMTGRLAAAFGIYLLTVNAVTTRERVRGVATLALFIGVVVSVLAMLEYAGVRPVLSWLTAFRPGVATVGAHVRAAGPLQYPTIASMYLEIVFAFGVGVMVADLDSPVRRARAGAIFAALVIVAEAIVLTFTRAGLITMAISAVFVGALRYRARGVDGGVRLIAALGVVVLALAAASRSTESLWLRMTSEGQESWYRADVQAPTTLEIEAGANAVVPITVRNSGRVAWDSAADPPVFVAYHWLGADGDRFVTFEGARTAFATAVDPGDVVRVDARVRPPRRPGRYRLEWDVVQEGRLWFSTEPGAARTLTQVVVGGREADAPPLATIPPPKITVRPGRLALWRAAIRMIAEHPLFGVGPDNFRLSYGAYGAIASADTRTHSNNMYLEVLAGGGVIAGAAFAWLLWRIGRVGAEALRASTDASVAAGIVGATLAIAVHATVDCFLSFAPTYVLFSLTLGCAAACVRGVEIPLAHRV